MAKIEELIPRFKWPYTFWLRSRKMNRLGIIDYCVQNKINRFAELISEIDISKYEQREFAHIVLLIKHEIFKENNNE